MLRLLNKNHKPVEAIEKRKQGIYWNSCGGQLYAFNGKSDYVMPMFSDEKIPLTSPYLKPRYGRLYRLTPKEVGMHIKILERGIPSIRFQIGWLEKNLSSMYKRRKRSR